MVKIVYLALVILLVGAFLLTGCGNSATTTTPLKTTSTSAVVTTTVKPVTTTTASAPTPQYGGTLRLIDDRPPSAAIGWFAEPGPPAGSFLFPMFEGLARAQYDGTIKPLLASSWDLSADLSSATFHLQKNVKFHDGSDFNATVAKWNLDQYIEAHMPAVKDVSSVDVIDDSTIKINLIKYLYTLLYDV